MARSLRRTCRAASIPASFLVATALHTTLAAAQETNIGKGFAVSRFEPSERGSHWFVNESLDLRETMRPALGVVGEYSYRQMIVSDGKDSVVRNALVLHPGGSMIFGNRLRLAASLPVQAFVDGHTGSVSRNGVTTTYPAPPDNASVGDLRFGADVRLVGVHEDPVTVAVGVQAWAPTGRKTMYSGDGDWRVRPRASVSGDIGSFTYAASAGFQWRARHDAIGTGKIGNTIGASVAVGVKLVGKRLVVGPELWGETVLTNAFGKKSTPIEALLGAHFLALRQLRIGAFGGAGLTRSYGAAVTRFGVDIEWAPMSAPDRDGDGVPDVDDACPDVKGERSADPAKNGCPAEKAPPPVVDTDGDGVPDNIDACPVERGTRTNDPATTGCPDTDGDGIIDKLDACPAQAGAANADPNLNGCPDKDGDGIPDKVDACPLEAGPANANPAKNGCPDKDRDNDGIPNEVDACPDDPGPSDPDPKRNGCPKAFISQGQIKILDQVRFRVNSAAIDPGPESLAVLQAVRKVLTQHPEVKRVRVEGHTDNAGAEAANKKLSADRAASVVKWLVDQGIDPARLTSVGLGPDRPIESNDTLEGKRKNRRVELHIE